jgi:hypothetical protein
MHIPLLSGALSHFRSLQKRSSVTDGSYRHNILQPLQLNICFGFFVFHEVQNRPKDAHDHIDQVKSLSEPFFVFGNE